MNEEHSHWKKDDYILMLNATEFTIEMFQQLLVIIIFGDVTDKIWMVNVSAFADPSVI